VRGFTHFLDLQVGAVLGDGLHFGCSSRGRLRTVQQGRAEVGAVQGGGGAVLGT
jgi:hypothetical protein